MGILDYFLGRRVLYTAIFLFIMCQIVVAQGTPRLIVRDFEKIKSIQTDYESLYVSLKYLIPQRMQVLFRDIYYQAILDEDSIYVLRSRFSRTDDIVVTSWKVINLRSDSARSSFDIPFETKEAQKEMDRITSARLLASIVVDSLEEVNSVDSASTLILVGSYEVDKDSNELGWLASVTMDSIQEALRQSTHIIATRESEGEIYIINGRYWMDENELVNAECDIRSARTGLKEFSIRRRFSPLPDAECVADSLAIMLFEDIIFNLRKATRIAIVAFSMSRIDSSYIFLSQAIPRMLESGLKGFRQLTLVEIDESKSMREILKTQTLEGRIDPHTHLKIGRIMRPNYLILGEYWVFNGDLGVEVRCLNIETSETVISEGFTLPDLDLEKLKAEVTKLSSKIRITIIRDIVERMHRRAVAVVGLPPFPNTRDNRERTKYIIKAISRKLKVMESDYVRVKEDRTIIDSFVEYPTNLWNMGVTLDVDRMLVIQYEDHDEGWVTIESDIFDIRDLRIPIHSHIEYGRVGEVQTMVDTIVKKALDSLGVEERWRYSVEKMKQLEDIHVRRVARPHSVTISYGRVITDTDGPLEYKENSNFVFYASLPLPSRLTWWTPRLKIVPMITWDWGNGTLENLFLNDASSSVHLISLFLCTKYCIWSPGDILNINAGLGVGFLWLRRIYGPDYNFLRAPADIKPGIAFIGDIEYKLSSKFSIAFPLKFYFSLGEFGEAEHNGRDFNGGCLWGINIGLITLSYCW